MSQKNLVRAMIVKFNTPGVGQLPQHILDKVVDKFLQKQRRKKKTKFTDRQYNMGCDNSDPFSKRRQKRLRRIKLIKEKQAAIQNTQLQQQEEEEALGQHDFVTTDSFISSQFRHEFDEEEKESSM